MSQEMYWKESPGVVQEIMAAWTRGVERHLFAIRQVFTGQELSARHWSEFMGGRQIHSLLSWASLE